MVTDLERDPNGDSYAGELKNGKKHGNGKMLWDDGEYEGEWKDLQDGKGIRNFFVTWHKREKGSKKLMDLYPGCCRARITKVTGRIQQGHLLFLQWGPV